MFAPETQFVPPVFHQGGITLLQCDVIDGLNSLATNSVAAMCLSNPYHYMVDYDEEEQHGLEPTLQAYLDVQVRVAKAAHRSLQENCIMAVVLGDTTNNYSPARGKEHKRVTGDWVGRRPLEPAYWLESEDKAVPWRYAIEVNAIAGFRYLGYRLWDKMGGGNRKTMLGNCDGEPILFFVKQTKGRRLHAKYFQPFDSMFLRHKPVHDKVHRCPYPEPLAREILEHIADPAHTVDQHDRLIVDFYCGSGTTNLAAHALGMNSIGIDLNCERAIALSRIRLLKTAEAECEAQAEATKPIQISLVTVGDRTSKKARGNPRENPGTSTRRQFPACGWVEEDNRENKHKGIRTTYYYRWQGSDRTCSFRLQGFEAAQKVRQLIKERKPVREIRAFLGDFD